MSIDDLPTDKLEAIDFANSEFAKGSIFWPRLLVRVLESNQKGKTLLLVLNLYKYKSIEERDISAEICCDELQDLLDSTMCRDSNHFRARAGEIWNDSRCRSLLCRGVTRLFGAASSILKHNFEEYEIELTKAIGMLTANDGVITSSNEFGIVLHAFQEEFEKK